MKMYLYLQKYLIVEIIGCMAFCSSKVKRKQAFDFCVLSEIIGYLLQKVVFFLTYVLSDKGNK